MNDEIIKFKIDEKSLFMGCTNDFTAGHTATVSSPINQSSNPKKWRNDILKLIDTNARLKDEAIPERLVSVCQSASKSENIIQDIFVFNNILLDGKPISIDAQFCMYIKKETAEFIKQLNGKITENTHLGRLKLHYPISLKYKADGFNIDNAKILNEILSINKEYAYIVRGFEYNQNNNTLNIITSLIGPKNALLSTVFKVKKGVGKKLRTDIDSAIVANINIDKSDEDISYDKYAKRQQTSRYNGKKGEDFIFDVCCNEQNDAYHTSVDYPESPYDIEYVDENGVKKYVEVKSTQSSKINFRMSTYEYDFMEKYKEQYIMYVVLNVKDEFPDYEVLTYNDIIKLNRKIVGYAFSK